MAITRFPPRCWEASILGAVAGAHFARAVAPAYGIPASPDMLSILPAAAVKLRAEHFEEFYVLFVGFDMNGLVYVSFFVPWSKEHGLFPTCQVRVARFYVSCLLLLFLLLLVFSTTIQDQCSLPDLNHEHPLQCSVPDPS